MYTGRHETQMLGGCFFAVTHNRIRLGRKPATDLRTVNNRRQFVSRKPNEIGSGLFAFLGDSNVPHKHLSNGGEAVFLGKGPGVVYLIHRSDGLYKIGHTCDFKKRFMGIRYENRDYILTLIHTIFAEQRIEVERFWHLFFDQERVRREWFRLSADDVRLFCACNGTRTRDMERTIGEFARGK